MTIGSHIMTRPQNNKPLSFKTVENMKPKDKGVSDTGENWGLRAVVKRQKIHFFIDITAR